MHHNLTVADLIGQYLAHLEATDYKARRSVRSTLRPFAALHPRTLLLDLQPRDVTSWLDSHPRWSSSTRAAAWTRLRTCLKWASDNGVSTCNPLASSARPARYRTRSRGAEFVLPDDLVGDLVRHARGRFRDLVQALASTGARPGELAHARAVHFCPVSRVIAFKPDCPTGFRHKTATTKRHGHVDRVIHLDGPTLALVERNAEAGGWLFPTRCGGRWTPSRIGRRWERLIARRQVRSSMRRHGRQPRHVIPYALRHTWITRAIKRGVSVKLVADLTGTSVRVIERHYSHAFDDRASMREAFLACL
jgi:integrase